MDLNENNNQIIIDAIGGVAQASLVTVVGYPFDLVKARMQVRSYSNSFRCVKSTVAKEGLLGLYRGSAMPWISHLIKRPIQYPLAEYMKSKLTDSDSSFIRNYGIGAANGLVGPIIGTPLQVVKISLQTSDGSKIKNSRQYIRDNFRRNGFRGFYRGFIPTAIKDVTFGTMFIGTYYTLRDRLGSDAWWKNFTSGATAHCLTWFTLIPIDHVKTKVQKSEKKIGVIKVIKDSYRVGGIRIFWKGVLPACLRTIPVSGVAMVGYEYVRARLTEYL
jgi:solute carrier family 25 (mitochondrial carnitine/acylcarnitine transporter), member 20/29